MRDVINTKLSTNLRNKLMVFLGVMLLLFGCDLNIGGGKDFERPPATVILRFTYSPDQVVSVGDTLTITCVVNDSLDSNLRYAWAIGIHASQYSEKNSITFKVKEGAGVVNGSIIIQKLNSDTDDVKEDFQFTVE